MALRGDSIDNIPGAPGIGDKGSVELIKRFGSVEQALERAAEVEKKTYRESLQNNRDNILISKKLVTIDCNVPVELDVTAMKAGAPDVEGSARALYRAGVHFAAERIAARSRGQRSPLPRSQIGGGCRSGAASLPRMRRSGGRDVLRNAERRAKKRTGGRDAQAKHASCSMPRARRDPRSRALGDLRRAAGLRSRLPAEARDAERVERFLRRCGDSRRAIHDYKAAIHLSGRRESRCAECGTIRCCTPTCSIQPTLRIALPDVALRRFNLKLSGNAGRSGGHHRDASPPPCARMSKMPGLLQALRRNRSAAGSRAGAHGRCAA